MAKKWSNKNLPGALHFVTGNVLNRRNIFRSPHLCRAFLAECQFLRENLECKLVAFVLMPDHFHLILNPLDGDIRRSIGTLKSRSAKAVVRLCPPDWFLLGDGTHQVWQDSFKALPLWSQWMIWQKINYIHSNPLKAGLVKSTADYQWSSFHDFYGSSAEPVLGVDSQWWWPGDVQKLAQAKSQWEKEIEDAWKEGRGQSRPS